MGHLRHACISLIQNLCCNRPTLARLKITVNEIQAHTATYSLPVLQTIADLQHRACGYKYTMHADDVILVRSAPSSTVMANLQPADRSGQ